MMSMQQPVQFVLLLIMLIHPLVITQIITVHLWVIKNMVIVGLGQVLHKHNVIITNLYEQSLSYTQTQFSQLYTGVCSGASAGNLNTGGDPYKANEYFVTTGACSSYQHSYPGPDENPDQLCQGCEIETTKASECFVIDTGNPNQDFKAAHHWVAKEGYAMTIILKLGESFRHIDPIKGKYPVDTVCDGGILGYHAMTVVATTNKWDIEYGSLRIQNSWGQTEWGDEGYFWLSREAFVKCDGRRLSWNTFDVVASIPSPTDNAETSRSPQNYWIYVGVSIGACIVLFLGTSLFVFLRRKQKKIL